MKFKDLGSDVSSALVLHCFGFHQFPVFIEETRNVKGKIGSS